MATLRSVKGNNSALLSDTQERRNLPWDIDGLCDPWGLRNWSCDPENSMFQQLNAYYSCNQNRNSITNVLSWKDANIEGLNFFFRLLEPVLANFFLWSDIQFFSAVGCVPTSEHSIWSKWVSWAHVLKFQSHLIIV